MTSLHAASRSARVSKVSLDQWDWTTDEIAAEEPLEIRLVLPNDAGDEEFSLSVTMRTPGEDAELAVGFLISEGLIESVSDITRIQRCTNQNVVKVHLVPTVAFDPTRLQRHFYTSSSCGVCGKASLQAVEVLVSHALAALEQSVTVETIHSLSSKLRLAQGAFNRTGGMHASGLFSLDGELLLLREDVGRHNALDKLIGAQAYTDPGCLDRSILVASGRISFELVQKALVVGIPIFAAVGAPSSLAIQLAARHSMTLIGFMRDQRFNVYSAPERIKR